MKIVQAWHDALNRGDVETLIALVAPDVAIGGPRGNTSGAPVLHEWFERANVKLYPRAYYAQNRVASDAPPDAPPNVVVVVEQSGEWHAPHNEEPRHEETVDPQTVATVFTLAGQQIAALSRYDTLDIALTAAGLSPADKVV